MNNLRKATITTLEVAEMMEVEHKRLLRKLEGDKDRKGYIQILNEAQMGLADFFIPSSYKDTKGEERPCYEVTRLGCDFLANKSTGEKGVLFTARYVKRFQEMENQVKRTAITEHPGEVANLIKQTARLMERQNCMPYKVAQNAKLICEQYGIELVSDFVKIPEYEQLAFDMTIRG